MDKWISVKDRLPEGDNCVLVVVNGVLGNIIFENAVQIAEYCPGEGWIVEGFWNWKNPDVTHWQNLPEPPKESD